MKVFSMFSGIGGFDLAMRNLGHEIVGACEIDKYAREVYSRHFPGVPIHNDATQVSPESLPQFDVLCAGFPCQAFSIAGKRRGFEDTRGSLFFEIARIAKEKKPSILLLENVKGLLSHDKGETFRTIISTLDEMGYDAEWQLLNSKYFVPQNRERIFIIGHLRGQCARQVFPLGDFDSKTDTEKFQKADELDELNAQCNRDEYKKGVVNDKGTFREVDPSTALDANYWKGCDNHAQRTMVKAVLTPDRLEKRQNGRRFKEDGEPAFTLNTQDKHGIFDGTRIRKLTPTECERLQGFPDGWTKGLSDTQRYKCCGNAVTVPVVQYIASHFEFPS
jgi:DNA (cytosine-5)-methyltransferase 1